jgi:serine/threonine protein kinase
MKVAFWSCSEELCPVSSNLAAISVAFAISYPYSVITLENRLRYHNLGKAYNGGSKAEPFNEVGTNYYEGRGIEGLLRKIYREERHSVKLKGYLKEIIQNCLYYIPQSRVIHNEIFDYEFEHCIHPLLDIIEECSDFCFIDTASTNSLSSRIILEEANLIVVNLSNKLSVLDHFFLHYSSLISKSIFIVSNYEYHNMLSIRNISKQFAIPIETIISLPRSDLYQDAYANGYVHEFISRNMNCHQDSQNYPFIQAVKEAARLIMSRSEMLIKQEELDSCGT